MAGIRLADLHLKYEGANEWPLKSLETTAARMDRSRSISFDVSRRFRVRRFIGSFLFFDFVDSQGTNGVVIIAVYSRAWISLRAGSALHFASAA